MMPLEGTNYETLKDEPYRSHFTSSSSINMMTANQPDADNVPNMPNQIEESKKLESSPFEKPAPNASTVEKLRYYICLPIVFVLHYTIPNSQSESSKLYLISFSMSLVWLSIFSYIMVWMITVIGFTFRIPDTVMGITLIAFGASVPDALSSLLVAKSGLGDMAVSNAIGSNVFDILVCLGIPWLVRCLTMQDKFISVKSKGKLFFLIDSLIKPIL
jgi:sodium/potassium/calcium exchanger 4